MKRSSTLARVATLALVGSLALAACGDDSSDDDNETSGNQTETTETTDAEGGDDGKQLYFVDGNTSDYSADFDEGTLEGVRATYPGAELADDFRERLLGIDPDLKDFTYGPESYDAVIVAALAAVAAESDDGKAIAAKMVEVSREGEKCTAFKQCADLLADGTDIDYDGVSGPIDFGATGSPTAATIGIFEYAADNTYSPTEFITGAIPDTGEVQADQEVGAPGEGDGELVIGTLLPQSGDLAFLGPPEFAGVDLAVQEINEAGGVLGKPVKQTAADSGDGTPLIAPPETDKLLKANSDVIVGAASSSVSLSVIDRITNAGVVMISPANTSTAFDTYADKGLYFRTAPSDVLQGQVMASTIIGDGHQNIAILARQEAYGEALANNVKKFYESQGGSVVSFKLYDPNAATFTTEVNDIKAQDPDAIVVIAFDETKKIVPELIKAGLGQG